MSFTRSPSQSYILTSHPHLARVHPTQSTWSTVERVVVDCSVWLRRNKRCSLYALCLKGLPRDVSATLAKYLNGSDPEPLRGQRSPGLIVSLVKAALEHLHAPLVSGDLYEKFMSVHEIRNAQRRVKMLQTLVDLVPPQQLGVLRTLMALLSDIYTFETQGEPTSTHTFHHTYIRPPARTSIHSVNATHPSFPFPIVTQTSPRPPCRPFAPSPLTLRTLSYARRATCPRGRRN